MPRWQQTLAKVTALIPGAGEPPYVDNTLPGQQPYPDNSLPGDQPYPDNTLPGQPPYPSQGPGFPTHPIVIPPGTPPGYHPSHPIVLPGEPSHPIVYPPAPPRSGGKPRGFPVKKTLQMGDEAPKNGPGPFGAWVVIDAGKGEPPAFGWLEAETPFPSNPTSQLPEGGHWVAIDLATPKDLEYHPATWVWVPEIDDDFGKSQQGQPKPTPQGPGQGQR